MKYIELSTVRLCSTITKQLFDSIIQNAIELLQILSPTFVLTIRYNCTIDHSHTIHGQTTIEKRHTIRKSMHVMLFQFLSFNLTRKPVADNSAIRTVVGMLNGYVPSTVDQQSWQYICSTKTKKNKQKNQQKRKKKGRKIKNEGIRLKWISMIAINL